MVGVRRPGRRLYRAERRTLACRIEPEPSLPPSGSIACSSRRWSIGALARWCVTSIQSCPARDRPPPTPPPRPHSGPTTSRFPRARPQGRTGQRRLPGLDRDRSCTVGFLERHGPRMAARSRKRGNWCSIAWAASHDRTGGRTARSCGFDPIWPQIAPPRSMVSSSSSTAVPFGPLMSRAGWDACRRPSRPGSDNGAAQTEPDNRSATR